MTPPVVRIRIEDFRKSFGNRQIHKGITFSVHQGECLGLVGGSGVGKSLILRSIIGLEKPDTGAVILDSVNITALSENDLIPVRKKVAYAFQGGALFDSMTIYENLAYPLREHFKYSEDTVAARINEQLKEFGLAGTENLYPGNISGGMQKRVGLARAMIMGPEIILYDEPTAGLDPFNTKRIQEIILNLKSKGVTSILVTHDMPTAFAVCDRFALIANGRIEFEGSPQEIEKDDEARIAKFINGEAS